METSRLYSYFQLLASILTILFYISRPSSKSVHLCHCFIAILLETAVVLAPSKYHPMTTLDIVLIAGLGLEILCLMKKRYANQLWNSLAPRWQDFIENILIVTPHLISVRQSSIAILVCNSRHLHRNNKCYRSPDSSSNGNSDG